MIVLLYILLLIVDCNVLLNACTKSTHRISIYFPTYMIQLHQLISWSLSVDNNKLPLTLLRSVFDDVIASVICVAQIVIYIFRVQVYIYFIWEITLFFIKSNWIHIEEYAEDKTMRDLERNSDSLGRKDLQICILRMKLSMFHLTLYSVKHIFFALYHLLCFVSHSSSPSHLIKG